MIGDWVRLAAAVAVAPVALRRAHRYAVRALAAFDATARPLIDDPALAALLRTWSVKGAHLIAAWCRLAAFPFPAGTAVLGCCFGRLYDDVLDDRRADPALARRLAALVAGTPVPPASAPELLLTRLHAELTARIGGDAGHPARRALIDLHRYQVLTSPGRPVADPDPLRETNSPGQETLHEITVRKGGLSLLVLAGLATRDLPPADRDLVFELGGCLQLVDDYQDRDADRRLGIRTTATEGRLRLADLVRRLRAVESAMRARYGRARSRVFFDDIYLFLLVAAAGRAWRRRPGAPRPPRRHRTPLAVLLRRGGSLLDG